MLDARSNALEVGISELCYPLDMLHSVDILADLQVRIETISMWTILPGSVSLRCTLLAVMSQFASLSFLKSISATGTCQSWTAGGLAVAVTYYFVSADDLIINPSATRRTIKREQGKVERIDLVEDDTRPRVRIQVLVQLFQNGLDARR